MAQGREVRYRRDRRLDREGRIESVDDGTVDLTGWRAEESSERMSLHWWETTITDLVEFVRKAADTMTPANFDRPSVRIRGGDTDAWSRCRSACYRR